MNERKLTKELIEEFIMENNQYFSVIFNIDNYKISFGSLEEFNESVGEQNHDPSFVMMINVDTTYLKAMIGIDYDHFYDGGFTYMMSCYAHELSHILTRMYDFVSCLFPYSKDGRKIEEKYRTNVSENVAVSLERLIVRWFNTCADIPYEKLIESNMGRIYKWYLDNVVIDRCINTTYETEY